MPLKERLEGSWRYKYLCYNPDELIFESLLLGDCERHDIEIDPSSQEYIDLFDIVHWMHCSNHGRRGCGRVFPVDEARKSKSGQYAYCPDCGHRTKIDPECFYNLITLREKPKIVWDAPWERGVVDLWVTSDGGETFLRVDVRGEKQSSVRWATCKCDITGDVWKVEFPHFFTGNGGYQMSKWDFNRRVKDANDKPGTTEADREKERGENECLRWNVAWFGWKDWEIIRVSDWYTHIPRNRFFVLRVDEFVTDSDFGNITDQMVTKYVVGRNILRDPDQVVNLLELAYFDSFDKAMVEFDKRVAGVKSECGIYNHDFPKIEAKRLSRDMKKLRLIRTRELEIKREYDALDQSETLLPVQELKFTILTNVINALAGQDVDVMGFKYEPTVYDTFQQGLAAGMESMLRAINDWLSSEDLFEPSKTLGGAYLLIRYVFVEPPKVDQARMDALAGLRDLWRLVGGEI